MYQKPTEPKSIGGILDDVFRLFREGFVPCLPVAAMVSIALLIPSMVLNSAVTTSPEGIPTAEFGMSYTVGMLGMYLVIAVGYAALIHRMDSFASGVNNSILLSVSAGAGKGLWVFLAMVIYFIVMMVGMILLLIPGLIVMVSMSFFIFAIVLDHKNAFSSLSHSHRLVWGQWWRVATLLGVATIASMVVYALFLSLVALFGVVDLQHFIEFSSSLSGSIISALIGLPIMIFMIATGLSVYYDLQLIKQGSDLESRMIEL